MHASKIVSWVIRQGCNGIHAKQAAALERALGSAVAGAALTMSSLATRLPGRALALRHRVKSVDRLLGGESLHAKLPKIYAQLCGSWLHGVTTLLVVVDWSDLTTDQSFQMLRASVVLEGRSQTVYQEAHPQTHYANADVHRRFLAELARVLPRHTKPIVMTDAGFRSNWFREVQLRGWSFVGRVRHRDLVRLGHDGTVEQAAWQSGKGLYAHARTGLAVELGAGQLVRNRPLPCRFVVYRGQPKGRHRATAKTRRSAQSGSIKQAATAQEPWLLACSADLGGLTAASIANLYRQRMRIEQEFRDTKNLRLGFGLSSSRSSGIRRLEMLLLIAHLAAFTRRLIGESIAEDRQLSLDLQLPAANRSPTASVMTLAKRSIEMNRISDLNYHHRRALWRLREQASNAPQALAAA